MRIHFFTAEFPFLKSETFIENELPIIAQRAEEIIIYPYNNRGETVHRVIPENCSVSMVARNSMNDCKISMNDRFILLNLLIQEFYLANNRWYYLKKIRKWNSLLKQAMKVANSMQISTEEKIDCYYSFWMNSWPTALMILKYKGKIDHFVFRCGGFDIWDERHEGNYLPFRGVIYKYCDGVFPNSLKAEKYLKSKDLFSKKIIHKYWGTKDMGINPFDKNKKFTLVSCSNVIPLKRVHLIVEILKELNFSLKWVHFGDGSEFDSIKEKAKSIMDHHEIVFKGRTSNKAVLDFYKSESVNLFITTSSTEGLPVSIQEAISFGIPTIATNVGGMDEVVTPETGILIQPDFNPVEIADQISWFKDSEMNSSLFREGVRNYWKQNFEDQIVYSHFHTVLTDIFKN